MIVDPRLLFLTCFSTSIPSSSPSSLPVQSPCSNASLLSMTDTISSGPPSSMPLAQIQNTHGMMLQDKSRGRDILQSKVPQAEPAPLNKLQLHRLHREQQDSVIDLVSLWLEANSWCISSPPHVNMLRLFVQYPSFSHTGTVGGYGIASVKELQASPLVSFCESVGKIVGV